MSWLAEVAHEALRVLWLSAPVLVAAAVQIAAIKLDWLPGLKRPLDGGRSWRGVRLLGDNKTWRGLAIYAGVSTVAILPQGLWVRARGLEYFDYGHLPTLVAAGALLGLGFALGELPNSFLKRRVGIAPGTRGNPAFVILDQVDSLIGCLVCLTPVWVAPPRVWAVTLVLCSGLHMLFNGVFVLLGLKKSVF